jgi:hypothetical protein
MNYGVPTAYNDHLLHIAAIRAMDSIHTFQMIPKLYTGTILKTSRAEYRRSNRSESILSDNTCPSKQTVKLSAFRPPVIPFYQN